MEALALAQLVIADVEAGFAAHGTSSVEPARQAPTQLMRLPVANDT